MSYCVNCGVELGDAEKNCPLCGVKVVNPLKQDAETAEKDYPSHVETLEKDLSRRFWVIVVSILLAVPSLICLICNLLYDGRISWSLYAIGGLAVVWAFGVSPFLFKKPAALKWIIIDIAAASGYLYLIEYSSSGNWFFPLAFPIILIAGLFVLIITVFTQRNIIHGLYIISSVLFSVGLLIIAVEALMDYYRYAEVHLVWSLFTLISCVAIALIFIFIERNKKVKEELKRKLHI